MEVLIIQIVGIKKNKKRITVEVVCDSGNETFNINEDMIILCNIPISKGANVSRESIEKAVNLSEVYNKAMRYLSLRDCTVFEIKRYLKNKGYESDNIDVIVGKLKEITLLDDRKYANRYFEILVKNRMVGPKYVNQKMFSKGIDKQIIDEILNKYTDELQQHNIDTWCKKKTQGEKSISKSKIVKFLLSKGFSYNNISCVVNQYEFKVDNVEEKEKLRFIRNLDKLFTKYSAKYNEYEVRQKLIMYLVSKGYAFDEAKSSINNYLGNK